MIKETLTKHLNESLLTVSEVWPIIMTGSIAVCSQVLSVAEAIS